DARHAADARRATRPASAHAGRAGRAADAGVRAAGPVLHAARAGDDCPSGTILHAAGAAFGAPGSVAHGAAAAGEDRDVAAYAAARLGAHAADAGSLIGDPAGIQGATTAG